MGVLATVRKEWFIIGIVLVILSAKVQPSIGVRGGEYVGLPKQLLLFLGSSLFKKLNYVDLCSSNAMKRKVDSDRL